MCICCPGVVELVRSNLGTSFPLFHASSALTMSMCDHRNTKNYMAAWHTGQRRSCCLAPALYSRGLFRQISDVFYTIKSVNSVNTGSVACHNTQTALYKHPVAIVNAGSLACHNTQTALSRPGASRYEDIIISIYIVMCELGWNILCKWTSDENLSRKCYTFYTFFTQE